MRKLSVKEWVAVAAAVACIALFFSSGLVSSLFRSGSGASGPNSEIMNDAMQNGSPEAGDAGEVSKAGSVITVNYTGTLEDGTVFDTSIGRGPFTFVVGRGDVIRGWDEGLLGVKKGDTKRIVLPPSEAYGAVQGHPLQHQTLIFDIEVLEVRNQ